MIALSHLAMSYGERTLFDDISLVIRPHDRIGLVGPNGSGKSTLLRIITGLISPEGGTVSKGGVVTIGYLPQDMIVHAGTSLREEAASAFEDILQIQQQLEETRRQLSVLPPESEEHGELVEIFGELQHKLEDLDAFRMHSKVERVLMGLGFSTQDFDRRTEEFSGGWQMRIALAKLLLREPSAILLDEPTNHLDLDSLRWLESYLRAYNGAVILVSHDRAFLDALTARTFAITNGSIDVYAGNYSFYERERALREDQLRKAQKNQERKIRQTELFIERFRYKATKARQVQSRVKQLSKIERIELPGGEEEVRFRFPAPEPSGAVVLELAHIAKHYDTLTVFDDLNVTIERGDRIAVVGVNGAGKSTFARVAAGVEAPDHGERKAGYHVVVSYFAQHQADELDLTKEVLETLDEIATGDVRTRLRTLLGSFLFHGDDVFKKVGVLSGGEKSRLALAKMLLHPANFLIMDEPTNHLDMRSKEVLQNALAEFDGTFMIVSHDRSFLDPLVTKVLEFSPGRLHVFPGTLTEFLQRKDEEALPAEAKESRPATASLTERERKRIEAERRQELSRTLKPHKERLEGLEEEIAALEDRKKELELLMESPEFYKQGDETRAMTNEYRQIGQRLEAAYAEWSKVAELIDNLRRA